MSDFSPISATNALVGYTGFVGSALLRQANFAHRYNSANIAEIEGGQFGTVVCAAAPGSMLEANTGPERDLAQIEALISRLEKVRAERFILISSIAVLRDFASGADETTTDFQQELAYGRHRRLLEAFIEGHFASSLVVRLPALFGQGLRKNFIFDLLNPVPSMLKEDRFAELEGQLEPNLATTFASLYTPEQATGMLKLDRAALNVHSKRKSLEEALADLSATATQFHNPDTTFQYYPIDRLWSDIEIATDAGLTHLHLASEPIKASEIHQRLLGRSMPATSARLHHEDMHTRHAELWNRTGPYQFDRDTTLKRLGDFFAGQKVPA